MNPFNYTYFGSGIDKTEREKLLCDFRPVLPVSLDCTFLIGSSASSQVHYQGKRPICFSLTAQQQQLFYIPYKVSILDHQ
jgi:hypothetical protein